MGTYAAWWMVADELDQTLKLLQAAEEDRGAAQAALAAEKAAHAEADHHAEWATTQLAAAEKERDNYYKLVHYGSCDQCATLTTQLAAAEKVCEAADSLVEYEWLPYSVRKALTEWRRTKEGA